MDTRAAQAWFPALIAAVIVILIGWIVLFPAVCRAFPLEIPGTGLDLCGFFG